MPILCSVPMVYPHSIPLNYMSCMPLAFPMRLSSGGHRGPLSFISSGKKNRPKQATPQRCSEAVVLENVLSEINVGNVMIVWTQSEINHCFTLLVSRGKIGNKICHSWAAAHSSRTSLQGGPWEKCIAKSMFNTAYIYYSK